MSIDRKFTHPYRCPVCYDGTIERELWEMLYGKNIGLHTCGQSSKRLSELKIWIGKQLDSIDFHGCSSCWSDSGGCTCRAEKESMKELFLTELGARIGGSCL